MRSLKGSASQILIVDVTAKDARHLQRITDVITDIKSGGNMNDTSTKVFISLGAVAHIVFNTGYIMAKYQPTISVSELLQKKHKWDISWCDVKTDKLREDVYKNMGISLNEQGDIITIKRDSFECSFEIRSTFELLEKFARLAREEKSLSNAVIKKNTTFTYIGSAAIEVSKPEPEVEQAKPVVIAIKVEQSKQKPRVTSNPYGGDYTALLAAKLNELIYGNV